MNRFRLLSAILVATIVLCGCSRDNGEHRTSNELSKWIGKNVVVQFRRDALGAAANLPISPDTGGINGASPIIVGPLLEVNAESIVIGNHQKKKSPKWIPREVILFIEVNP